MHFGECTEEGVHALRELGIRNLAGYFIMHKGAPLVSYFYPESLILHVGKRDLWFDRETDMLYARISSVLNRHTADESIAMLEKEAADPRTSGYLEVMIHEEYFYPDSKIYLPDFEERLLLPCKWLYDHGYRGSFIDDLR